jgi:nicotinamide-nucleotide amidase
MSDVDGGVGVDKADISACSVTVDPAAARLAASIATRLGTRRVACAESFTAGLIGQALAAAPGASEWFDGSILTYRTERKRSILGVTAASIFSNLCALQMATGAAELFDSQVALATTGVAGPDPQDGLPPGTVVVAWLVDGEHGTRTLQLPGDPEQVVAAGVRTALAELDDALRTRAAGDDM